jgi:hypothetical protein
VQYSGSEHIPEEGAGVGLKIDGEILCGWQGLNMSYVAERWIVRGVNNQAVGDCPAFLMVEHPPAQAVVGHLDWAALYGSPSRLSTLLVEDRSVVTMTNADVLRHSRVLQAAIDSEVAKYPQNRYVVRASGTEDDSCVYAEADTRMSAMTSFHWKCCALVHQFAGGLGDPPSCISSRCNGVHQTL